MRVLYCGMKADYGDPARGLTFEHKTFYQKSDAGLSTIGEAIVKALCGRGRDAATAPHD